MTLLNQPALPFLINLLCHFLLSYRPTRQERKNLASSRRGTSIFVTFALGTLPSGLLLFPSSNWRIPASWGEGLVVGVDNVASPEPGGGGRGLGSPVRLLVPGPEGLFC